jgi:hypothetical protein
LIESYPTPFSRGRALECLAEVEQMRHLTGGVHAEHQDRNVDKARGLLEMAERHGNTFLLAHDPRDSEHYQTLSECHDAAVLAREVLAGRLTCNQARVKNRRERKADEAGADKDQSCS